MPRDSDACRMENAIKEDNVDRRRISALKSEALREAKAVGKTERAYVWPMRQHPHTGTLCNKQREIGRWVGLKKLVQSHQNEMGRR